VEFTSTMPRRGPLVPLSATIDCVFELYETNLSPYVSDIHGSKVV